MTAQNAAQFLPLVQALADGKTIQFVTGHGTWVDYHPETSYTFGVDPSLYRIKPEPPKPREFWLEPAAHTCDGFYVRVMKTNSECIHVREVLPEAP